MTTVMQKPKTPLDRSLYAVRPARVLFDIARSYLLIAVALFVAFRYRTPLTWAGAVLVIGSQQYALQILLRDGLHGRLLASKQHNDLLCRVTLANFLFTPFAPFRDKHLAHHRHLGTVQDPDRYYHCSEDKARKPDYLLFLTAFRSIILTLIRAGAPKRKVQSESEAETTATPVRRSGRADVLVVLLTNLLLLGGLTVAFGWYGYFLFWMLPFIVGVYVPQNFRSFAEHAQAEADELADTHRLVTFVSNPIERWFFAPNNMNFHAEHHLYPAVPYYSLPKLRRFLEETGQMETVEYRGSYLRFAMRYWRALPLALLAGHETMQTTGMTHEA